MKIDFNIYNQILFNDLRPWISENVNEVKFREILNNKVRANKDNPEKFFKSVVHALKDFSIKLDTDITSLLNSKSDTYKNKQSTDYQLLIETPLYFNKATEFYFYIIVNESLRIRAALFSLVNESNSDIDKTYYVAGTISQIQYLIEQVSKVANNDKQSQYVINVLKLVLFALYFEIKHLYPDYLGNETLSENEIINQLSNDYDGDKVKEGTVSYNIREFLDKQSKPELIAPEQVKESENKNVSEPEKQAFQSKQLDFRENKKTKLTYDDITNKDLFTRFEEKLYLNDYIDINYNFTNKHNKKKELAAIYAILIEKNYFRKSNYKYRNGFDKANYRQYLDERYNVDTSQQFSRIKPEFLKEISEKYHWIDTLPNCR